MNQPRLRKCKWVQSILAACVLLATASAVKARTVDQEPRTCLLLPLKAQGVDTASATLVTEQLAATLAAWPDLHTLTADDVAQLLEAQSNAWQVDCGAKCQADISRLTQAKWVLSGSVGKVGSDFVMSLTLMDAEEGSSRSAAQITAPALERLNDHMRELLADLFATSAPEASTFQVPQGKTVSLGVFGMKAVGLPEALGENLLQVLATQLKNMPGTSVIGRDDLASLLELEARKSLFECSADLVCLAQIGGALGVDNIVAGTVGLLGADTVIALRLINVSTVSVDNRVTQVFKGQREQLIPGMRIAAMKLLGRDATGAGQLAISANLAPARAYLDERPLGQLPIARSTDTPGGRHLLRIEKEGYATWTSDVFVIPGATTRVRAELEPVAPWYATWWAWTAGTAVISGGIATYVILNRSDNTAAVRASAPPLPQ